MEPGETSESICIGSGCQARQKLLNRLKTHTHTPHDFSSSPIDFCMFAPFFLFFKKGKEPPSLESCASNNAWKIYGTTGSKPACNPTVAKQEGSPLPLPTFYSELVWLVCLSSLRKRHRPALVVGGSRCCCPEHEPRAAQEDAPRPVAPAGHLALRARHYAPGLDSAAPQRDPPLRFCGTQNVTVGGYYPGVILGFGSFLGIIGSNLIENKRQMLVASIVFISFGVIAAFCCAIVDGVFAARHIDLRPLYAGRCHYYSKSTAQPEAVCHPQHRSPCTPKIKGNTCFCCDLYNCGRVEISGGYYEYIDVSSCQDIIHLYHLLWSATILNIVGLFLGIITAAILGGFKDMTPSLPAINCTVENARPTVSYYSRPQVTSYNTYYHSTPHLPPYSAYDFQHSSVFPASTPSGLSDDPLSVSPSPSYVWSPTAPPRYSPPYFPPFEKPPPYTP
uniref:Transmembrane protein 255A n=2 Tax=Podarcis muralis TaxID=64176 RepID=A0A670K2H8_PODMU